ncbi:peptidase S8/S53 domain-containing protein, partial [Apiosordaria backusii]
VAFAAPAVEHLHLYWSGNQAVLKGWSCPTGIAQLHSSTKRKLKTVTVHASPVSGAGAAGSGSGNDEAERQHAWVRRMEDFRRAMISLHTVLQSMNLGTPERVKVALIDDGVDLSSLDSYNDIVQATGLSYYPPDGNFEMPWHRSSTGHGTIMANMIVRINPWVTLYVMKIQDGPSSDNIGRTIFADSTAKAIRGAISRKVDVISMSWTVKKKTALVTGGAGGSHIQATSVEGDAIRELEDALQAAIDAKILLFCSASDDIQAKGTDYLPYSKDPHYIFRIGAALSLGQRDPHAEDKENINYFFPGNQVADALNPRSTAQVRYHDGSSVGTALAAGLASMVIYCAVIMQTCLKTYYKKFEGIAAEVRRRDRMERAFDRVVRWNPKSIEDKKYLPVWESFGVAADSIHEAVGERKLEILEEFVMKLCS